MSALAAELRAAVLAALRDPEGRAALVEAVREAVTATDERLIDVDEAAQLTGRSVEALWKSAKRGSIPSVKQGRRVLFRRSDLLAK